LKKEVFDDLVVFEVDSMEAVDLTTIDFDDKPYSVRVLEKRDETVYRLVLNFNEEGVLMEKVSYLEDLNGNEVQCIEYDGEDNIIRRIEYDNYQNGETKWMYVYDDKDNLINKQFFEEDLE